MCIKTKNKWFWPSEFWHRGEITRGTEVPQREMQTTNAKEFSGKHSSLLSTCGWCAISLVKGANRQIHWRSLPFPAQNCMLFMKIITLLNTQHSSEIRETCKYNATRVNEFLPGSTPFKSCECGGGGWEQALADLGCQASEPVDKKALCVMVWIIIARLRWEVRDLYTGFSFPNWLFWGLFNLILEINNCWEQVGNENRKGGCFWGGQVPKPFRI